MGAPLDGYRWRSTHPTDVLKRKNWVGKLLTLFVSGFCEVEKTVGAAKWPDIPNGQT
jgi:hypothetical protein